MNPGVLSRLAGLAYFHFKIPCFLGNASSRTLDGGSVADISSDEHMKYIYVALSCVGLVGNSIVIITLAKFQQLRKKIPNIYIINQVIILLTESAILYYTTVSVKRFIYALCFLSDS